MSLEGADLNPYHRVHPALCTSPGWEGRNQPAPFCLLLSEKFCFLFLLFCFQFGCLLFKGKRSL